MLIYLKEALELHNELNPKLWQQNNLKLDVLQKLKQIAEEFLKYIDIPLNVVDIEIVGSNASYNYNEKSDLDLHIIVNSEINYVEPTILRQLYNSKKNSFNDNYDLSGWGPDYGDPSTYLDTFMPAGGYMTKCIGLY